MSLSRLIKQNPIIFAGVMLAISIYISFEKLTYDYVDIGHNRIAIFKQGSLEGFCYLSLDTCYYSDGNGEFWVKPLNLNTLIEQDEQENAEWKRIKRQNFENDFMN